MKLSIITINYNDAKGLERTLDSIIPRKVEGVELIVIDGGSNDTSLDVILHHNEHIDFYVSESDKGIYNAMNKGIANSNGEYVMFINSGDTLMSSSDFNLILARITGEDIIYHNLEIVEEDKNSYIKIYPKQLDFKYFAEDTLPHTGTLIKKNLFTKFGNYNERLKIISDWAFYMDCVLLHNCSYKYIDDCFASFYLGGISSQPQNFKLLMDERDKHISEKYAFFNSLYCEWKEKKNELYKLKSATSVRYLKKIGFLKWLDI